MNTNAVCIDNDIVSRGIIAKIFELHGIFVYQANNGQEGVNYLYKKRHVKYVIVDLHLAISNGFNFLVDLITFNADPDISIIISSWEDYCGFKKIALQKGLNLDPVYGYLRKPYDLHKIGSIINSLKKLKYKYSH